MTSQRRDDRDAPGFSLSRGRLLQGASRRGGQRPRWECSGSNDSPSADLPLPSGRAFIFCYFPGGWDQLLFLDPRDPTALPRLRPRRQPLRDPLQRARGRQRVLRAASSAPPTPSSPLTFGPAAAKTADAVKLTDFADRIAIVRGHQHEHPRARGGLPVLPHGKVPRGHRRPRHERSPPRSSARWCRAARWRISPSASRATTTVTPAPRAPCGSTPSTTSSSCSRPRGFKSATWSSGPSPTTASAWAPATARWPTAAGCTPPCAARGPRLTPSCSRASRSTSSLSPAPTRPPWPSATGTAFTLGDANSPAAPARPSRPRPSRPASPRWRA
jgi:hypothetical protein